MVKNLQTDYELDLQQFGEIALLIKNEGFANGIVVFYAYDKVYIVSFSSAKITMKGIDFLEENNSWAKAYNTIKEGRDWLKL
jgi:hypothetical protein